MSNSAVRSRCTYWSRLRNKQPQSLRATEQQALVRSPQSVGCPEWPCSSRPVLVLGQQASRDPLFPHQWQGHVSPSQSTFQAPACSTSASPRVMGKPCCAFRESFGLIRRGERQTGAYRLGCNAHPFRAACPLWTQTQHWKTVPLHT